MSHATGRHRRRRQGWASRARWAVGAVLAAIVGVKPAPPQRTTPSPQRLPQPRPVASHPPGPPSCGEPGWVRRYDEARRVHADRSWALFTEGGGGARSGAVVELPEFGWCVDDDGVAAVRPYLVAHEKRQRANLRRSSPSADVQRTSAPYSCDQSTGSVIPGEWDELAGLIRQWHAQRTPVA